MQVLRAKEAEKPRFELGGGLMSKAVEIADHFDEHLLGDVFHGNRSRPVNRM